MDIDTLNIKYNKKRLTEVYNNPYFIDETNLLENAKVLSYYKHIIKNVDIDPSNPKNSYIMWIFDKVDTLNQNSPVNIDSGHTSLPDVDMDFEIQHRGAIIDYIREKYGRDKVAQMLTFTRLQGRGALKDVMRAHGTTTFEEMNRITAHIPDEAEISDQLQAMREADMKAGGDGEASIIQWALEHNKEELKQWAFIDDDGNIQGPYAKIFEQAIRLEGTKKSQSKHAAGIVIAQQPLHEICPMVYDKSSGEMIAGLEMNALESMGHVKFDILGVAMLSKVHWILDLLKHGEINGL